VSLEPLLAAAGASVGLLVGLLTAGLSRAPGLRGLRWLGLIVVSASAVCVLRSLAGGASDSTVLAMVRVGMAISGLMLYAWLRYEASEVPRPVSRFDRALRGGALGFGALCLVPSLMVGTHIVRHGDGFSGGTYVDVAPTPLGSAGLFALIGAAVVLQVRYVRRWRAGSATAAAHATGLAALQVTGALDTVDGAWRHDSIHLMPFGLLAVIVAIGAALVGQFVARARSLAEQTDHLGHVVVQRSTELESARATLVETRSLVTLGRLSAAVAHEINNPLAVVAANLGFIRAGDASRAEVHEAMQDTLTSVERIAGVVRQLGEAGELAGARSAGHAVSLLSVVDGAVATAREQTGFEGPVSLDVPPTLYTSTQELSLQPVVAKILAGAMQAICTTDCGGGVRVRAVRRGDRVSLWIEDDAPEQDDILRERRFGAILDTRPQAVQADVGLSVSLALLRVLQADIVLERAGEDGSVVRFDLDACEAPARSTLPPVSTVASRAHLLVVDDDVLTRIGLRRLLGREYVVDEAASVEEAMAFVQEHRAELDAIVCDVVMPDGGAELLLERLEAMAPQLARATVLVTGGAIDRRTATLLDRHADRVLRKPVDLAALRALVERHRIRRAAIAAPRREA
jgi:CheY-like chemotaxis protein/signal transduction histidine kinase